MPYLQALPGCMAWQVKECDAVQALSTLLPTKGQRFKELSELCARSELSAHSTGSQAPSQGCTAHHKTSQPRVSCSYPLPLAVYAQCMTMH